MKIISNPRIILTISFKGITKKYTLKKFPVYIGTERANDVIILPGLQSRQGENIFENNNFYFKETIQQSEFQSPYVKKIKLAQDDQEIHLKEYNLKFDIAKPYVHSSTNDFNSDPIDLKGINGWLMFVAINLAIIPIIEFINISNLISFLSYLKELRESWTYSIINNSSLDSVRIFLIIETACVILLFVYSIILNIYFYFKKRHFPLMMIIFLSALIILTIFDSINSYNIYRIWDQNEPYSESHLFVSSFFLRISIRDYQSYDCWCNMGAILFSIQKSQNNLC